MIKRLILQLAAVILATVIGRLISNAMGGDPVLTLLTGLASAALALLTYTWVVRLSERRVVTETARRGALRAAGLGTVIGVGLFAAVIASIAVLGAYRIDGFGSVFGLIGLIGFMAAAAVTEEVIFRGVLFRLIEEKTGTWVSMAVTAVLFGSMHLINPHATIWGAIAIALTAGVLLTAAYVATRRLWLPIGLHFGWNIAVSGIFSTVVSGAETPLGLLKATMSGPELITGGAFGPEGSVITIAFSLVASAVFLRIAHRRGRIVPLRRSARADAVTVSPV